MSFDHPAFQLEIACISVTYVRALGRDLAQSLGTAAVMSALERTAIGDFTAADATRLDELTAENLTSRLAPTARAVSQLPQFTLTAAELRLLEFGNPLDAVRPDGLQLAEGQEAAALIGTAPCKAGDPSVGELAAVLVRRGNALRCVRNLVGK